jgi:hypothetical protein
MSAPRLSLCLSAAFSARNCSFSARRRSSSVSPAVKGSGGSASGSAMATAPRGRAKDRQVGTAAGPF